MSLTVCPVCNGPMKPLFTGFFCPKECDRPKQVVAVHPSISDPSDIYIFKHNGQTWSAYLEKVKSPGDSAWRGWWYDSSHGDATWTTDAFGVQDSLGVSTGPGWPPSQQDLNRLCDCGSWLIVFRRR